jgi:hypothetical protein
MVCLASHLQSLRSQGARLGDVPLPQGEVGQVQPHEPFRERVVALARQIERLGEEGLRRLQLVLHHQRIGDVVECVRQVG